MSGTGGNRSLFGEELRSIVTPLLPEFGASDRKRLERLLAVATAEQFRLSDALAAAFTDLGSAQALKAFTNFRSRFNQLAEEKAVEIRLEADSRKRDAPEDWRCWFEGADPSAALVAQFTKENTADLPSGDIRSRAILTDLVRSQMLIRIFISYAHADKRYAEVFIEELRRQFKPSRYNLDIWIDHEIRSGERWHESIQEAIARADFGLFLISPGFLGSEYIRQHELPHFVGTGAKPALLLALRQFHESQLHEELSPHQIFGFPKKFFDASSQPTPRVRFVHKFYLDALERLDKCAKASTSSLILTKYA